MKNSTFEFQLPYNVTKSELFVLGYIAYSQPVFSLNSCKRICTDAGLKECDLSIIKKYLVSDEYYRYYMNMTLIFQIIFSVMEKYPSFINIYKKEIKWQRSNCEAIWEIAYFLMKFPGHEVNSRLINLFIEQTRSIELFLYFKNFIYQPSLRPFLVMFSDTKFFSLIEEVLLFVTRHTFDYFEEDKLLELVDFYSENTTTNLIELKDEIKTTQFLIDGRIPDFQGRTNEWTLAVDAIVSLYQNDITTAYSKFQSSLRLYNKNRSEKNYYNCPILTFYLTLCYCRANNADSRKKISILLNKETYSNNIKNWASACLAKYVGLNINIEKLKSEYFLDVDFSDMGSSLCYMVNIIKHYFNESYNIRFKIPDFADKIAPKSILVKYELSNYIPSFKDKDIAPIFVSKPIISYLKRKENWERNLEEILDIIPKNRTNKAEANESQKRIIYVIDSYSRVDIKEQKIKKSGEWNNGTSLTFSTFISQKLTYLDPMDKQIVNNHLYVNPRGYSLHKKHVIPYMVGSDKVYFESDDSNTLQPVSINEEKAYFSVIKDKNGSFKISNNLPNGIIDRIVIRQNSNTNYTVFKLNELEYQIIRKISDMETLPADSEKMLMSLFEKLDGFVEVHSPLIKGGSMLEKIKGDSKIVLQLKPTGSCSYYLNIFARPLTNGKLEFIPGDGKATIFDSNSEKRYQIERDLEKEKDTYELLTDYLFSNEDAEESEPGKWVLTPKGMLDILNLARENDKIFSIEWPQGQSVNIKTMLTKGMVSASLKHNESWFEMEGKVTIDKKNILTLQQLITLFNENRTGQYIQLSDDEFIILEDSLKKQLQKLSEIATSNKRISIFQVGKLAELVYENNPLLTADSKFKELEDKMQKASKLDPKIPTNLDAELRDYQTEGFKWMARLTSWGAGACLADDMGLGKTIQTITLMLYRKGATLVVAPASVVLNWYSEIEKFAPTLNTYILNETNSREDIIEKASKGDVVLCSYGILQREEELITKKKWDLVCLDEAHTIKNHGTKTSMAAMKIKADARIALTGTPIQNNLNELWNIFQFLNPGLLGSYESFSKRFTTASDNKGSIRRLKTMIQPFMLRRRKSDVIEELPEKTDIRRMVEMSGAELTAYEAIRESTKQALESTNKVDVSILAQITKLRQASCSMKLIEANWPSESTKQEYAVDLLSQITDGGNRVLVFSQFTSFLTMVRDSFVKSTDNKIPNLYLDGSTPIRKREEMVKKFQEGEAPVFFISLKAGGLGLNLTGANYVIHLDPWWNPAIEAQATDRAHRIGQKQNVTVYHLLCKHTIEEKILRLHRKKQDIADFLMEGTNVTTSLTIEDLRALVKNDD